MVVSSHRYPCRSASFSKWSQIGTARSKAISGKNDIAGWYSKMRERILLDPATHWVEVEATINASRMRSNGNNPTHLMTPPRRGGDAQGDAGGAEVRTQKGGARSIGVL